MQQESEISNFFSKWEKKNLEGGSDENSFPFRHGNPVAALFLHIKNYTFLLVHRLSFYALHVCMLTFSIGVLDAFGIVFARD